MLLKMLGMSMSILPNKLQLTINEIHFKLEKIYLISIFFIIILCTKNVLLNSNRPDPITEKPYTKAPEGEGCPRCGAHVYAAEQMLARGRVN